MLRELGDRCHEAECLVGLGEAQEEAGDFGAARATWGRALEILERINPLEADRIRGRLDGPAASVPRVGVPGRAIAGSSRADEVSLKR